MIKVTAKLEHRPLRLLELEFGIVHFAGIVRKDAGVLTHLRNKEECNTWLEGKVSVLTVLLESFAGAFLT